MSAAKWAARYINRNPRNNELVKRQSTGSGYQFETDRATKVYIYRVELEQSKSHQEARLVHHRDGPVIVASTREKAVAQQLYSNTDTCAAMNLGRILAMRCLESGIHFAMPAATREEIERSQHQFHFIEALKSEGLKLEEPSAIEHSHRTDEKFAWERYPMLGSRQTNLDELWQPPPNVS
ncbi:hypothetical protein WR25_04523 [Diploscapter pachys]|uniref:Large ribosomal subunit protein uL18m n=1 Tax=Diploscapter pachys TaxID=2018661 RepID=A0A2A2LG43_9BILA|nr:hypothetical protein WR25_04523 [Diploscapter pachys]